MTKPMTNGEYIQHEGGACPACRSSEVQSEMYWIDMLLALKDEDSRDQLPVPVSLRLPTGTCAWFSLHGFPFRGFYGGEPTHIPVGLTFSRQA